MHWIELIIYYKLVMINVYNHEDFSFCQQRLGNQ